MDNLVHEIFLLLHEIALNHNLWTTGPHKVPNTGSTLLCRFIINFSTRHEPSNWYNIAFALVLLVLLRLGLNQFEWNVFNSLGMILKLLLRPVSRSTLRKINSFGRWTSNTWWFRELHLTSLVSVLNCAGQSVCRFLMGRAAILAGLGKFCRTRCADQRILIIYSH